MKSGGDALTIVQAFDVNSVVWLRSLPDAEMGPSRRMVEDLEAQAAAGAFAFAFEVVEVGSRERMLAALTAIVPRCAAGLRPILHFDCHGSAADGLLLAPSGERLAWAQLVEALRAVNVAAGNSVCCVFAVCFGLHLSLSLSLTEPSPYFVTIAPEAEVQVGELLDRVAPFYARLLETGNVSQAHRERLAPVFSIFYSAELLAKGLATYIAGHATGAAGVSRRERIVTRMLDEQGDAAPRGERLPAARRRVREGMRLTQAHLDRYAGIFLIGREPGFGLAEVERLAEGMVRQREALRRRGEKAAKARRGGRLPA